MKRLVLLFPGQGSQYIGMGKDLYDNFITAKHIFEEASDAIGIDMQKLCFESSAQELTSTQNAQPAIVTVSVCAYRAALESFDIKPFIATGHSLGEFSALTCAGAIKFSDCIKIVRKRGELMHQVTLGKAGTMAAIIGLDNQTVEDQCQRVQKEKGFVVVSNYNSPKQLVISGNTLAVLEASEKLKDLGAKVVPLKVSAPFHSPLMEPIAEPFKEELKKYKYYPFDIPIISNVTAEPYKDIQDIIPNLTQQLVNAVKWQSSMKYLYDNNIDIALELGPKAVLKKLMQENVSEISVYSYDNEKDRNELKKVFSTQELVGNHYSLISRCLAIAVCTKNRNWNNEEYEKGVIEPYRRIKKLKVQIEEEDGIPTNEQMLEALDMLKSVFDTKKVTIEEQRERFNQVLKETGTEGVFGNYLKI